MYSSSGGLFMYYVCQVGEGWRKVKLNSQELGNEIYQKRVKGQTVLSEGEQRRGVTRWEMTLHHVCEWCLGGGRGP